MREEDGERIKILMHINKKERSLIKKNSLETYFTLIVGRQRVFSKGTCIPTLSSPKPLVPNSLATQPWEQVLSPKVDLPR